MKTNRVLGFAAAALTLVVAGSASAEQTVADEMMVGQAVMTEAWQGYAPRCQPTELTRDAALRDPCDGSVAIFGVAGPTVLSRFDALDVQSTGSITR